MVFGEGIAFDTVSPSTIPYEMEFPF
jgi:hypothetical protein